MADIPVKIYRSNSVREGTSPSNPSFPADQDPVIENPAGTGTPDHNSLNSLQGGNATERYHLTKDKAEAAEAANAPTSSNPFATVLDLDDYVPFSGATQDVDLGEQGITTEWVKLNTTPVIPTDQGSLYWDEDDNVIAVVLNGVIQKVGEVTFYNVKNQTGSTIPKGTGVGFAGVIGASGRIKVAPYLADGSQPSIYYVGITAEQILNGEDGKVYNFGPIRGLNTSAFNEGDVLYASSTVAGGFTTTPPTTPNNVIVVAAVLTDSATVGSLLVRVTAADLGHPPVSIGSPSNGLSIIPSTQVLSLGIASSGVTGALSGTDWDTFNGKIGGSIGAGQVAFGTGTGTIGGDSGLTWDNINKKLFIGNSGFAFNNILTVQTDSLAGRVRKINIVRNVITQGAELSFNEDTRLTLGVQIGSIGFTYPVTFIQNGLRVGSFQSGLFAIGNITPTNTIDINGDARIRTINNATGNFLTTSATGVVQQRTAGEVATDIGAVTITGTQTITGEKTFNANLNIGNTALDYVSWDNTSKTFGIFSQTQYIHKYRGGASGALNMGQYDVDGNASINNTSNAKLLFGTNNITRLEIGADGDIIIPSVPSGTGDTLMIEAGGRIVKGTGGGGTPNSITITSTSTVTIDLEENKWNNILLQSNAVINIQSIVTSNYFKAVLRIKQDTTGSRTITWNTGGQGIIWKLGDAPTLAGSANWEDLIELFYDGVRINGVHYGSFG